MNASVNMRQAVYLADRTVCHVADWRSEYCVWHWVSLALKVTVVTLCIILPTQCVCVVYGCQTKQRLFPYIEVK
jgi:hypothetical protein